MEPMVLTRRDAAQVLAPSTRTIDRLCATGQIEYIRIGNRVRILKGSLEEFLQSKRLQAPS
jgi:excisionase family DNA binding protein